MFDYLRALNKAMEDGPLSMWFDTPAQAMMWALRTTYPMWGEGTHYVHYMEWAQG